MSNRVRELRKVRALTQEGLAERIGTTPQTIQRLETGQRRLNDVWIRKLSSALDVTADELLGGIPGFSEGERSYRTEPSRETDAELFGWFVGEIDRLHKGEKMPLNVPALAQLAYDMFSEARMNSKDSRLLRATLTPLIASHQKWLKDRRIKILMRAK